MITFFGNIRHYKGLEVLLKAFSKVVKTLPNSILIIAGRVWGDWEQYQNIIDNHNLRNKVLLFLKYIENKDVKVYLTATDIYVLPYKYFDSQSAAGNLGLLFGKAIVVTNTGKLTELVKDKQAIVKPNNVQQLACAIENILSSEQLQNKLENDSSNIARKYSRQYLAKQLYSIYSSVLEK